MDYTQDDINSLAKKLDALSDGEKLALQGAAAAAASDVDGFKFQPEAARPLQFDKIEWVFTHFTSPGDVPAFTSPGDIPLAVPKD